MADVEELLRMMKEFGIIGPGKYVKMKGRSYTDTYYDDDDPVMIPVETTARVVVEPKLLSPPPPKE